MTDAAVKHFPRPTPETQAYWQGCRKHQLLIQRCTRYKEFQFYPRVICSKCMSGNLEWEKASGRGKILTYTIVRRAPDGAETARHGPVRPDDRPVRVMDGPHQFVRPSLRRRGAEAGNDGDEFLAAVAPHAAGIGDRVMGDVRHRPQHLIARGVAEVFVERLEVVEVEEEHRQRLAALVSAMLGGDRRVD